MDGVIQYAMVAGRRLKRYVLLIVSCVGLIMKNLELGLYFFFTIVYVNCMLYGLN